MHKADKMWHNGLEYKQMKLSFPVILEKKALYNFLDDKTAKINIDIEYSKGIKLLRVFHKAEYCRQHFMHILRMIFPHLNTDAEK